MFRSMSTLLLLVKNEFIAGPLLAAQERLLVAAYLKTRQVKQLQWLS